MNNYVKTIKGKIEKLHDMSETESKQTILEVLSMTESWISLEDLEQILPSEQYQDIKIRLEEKIRDKYQEKEGWSSEKLNELYKRAIGKEKFFVVKDENAQYALRRFNYADIAADRNFLDINIEEIENLNNVAINIMQNHKSYGEFHKNEVLDLDKEEIPELLDNVIQKLSSMTINKITAINIEEATRKVRIEEFKQATNTIRESAKEEQKISNEDILLDNN